MHRFRYLFGLIGYPLGHSFSRTYMREKIAVNKMDADYTLFPIEEVEQLLEILKRNTNLIGLNVTIPHKQSVMPLLDEVDPVAAAIGAVNTILNRHGALTGYNTDYAGFRDSLVRWVPQLPESALILGTGGASKAVQAALTELGIEYLLVSRAARDNVLGYQDCTAKLISDTRLIINTTPLGMYPHITHYPALAYDVLTPDHYLYDLVYNPEKTLFLKRGEDQGSRIKNGLEMLHLQADHAWEIWKSYLDGTHGRP